MEWQEQPWAADDAFFFVWLPESTVHDGFGSELSQSPSVIQMHHTNCLDDRVPSSLCEAVRDRAHFSGPRGGDRIFL